MGNDKRMDKRRFRRKGRIASFADNNREDGFELSSERKEDDSSLGEGGIDAGQR
jgi:hypothetical protein